MWTARTVPRNHPHPVPRTTFRLILTVALALHSAALLPSGAADDKKKATPVMAPAPPPAMPQSVKVARGQKIEIPLRTFGRHNEQLRYLIRAKPEHGRLSEPRVTEREVSVVTYEPPADLAVTSDQFRFSVKTSVGVSAPVEVKIAIVDEMPVLAIPDVLDFGGLLVGATATREFELANRGGGVAEGDLKLPPPWKVEGRQHYQLAAGESATYKIVFAPTEDGDFRGEIVFPSNPEHTTALHGTAAMPVSAEPAAVALEQQPGFGLRTGVFEIVNRTGEARRFRLSAGPRLRIKSEVAVPAGGRLAVAVSTQTTDVAPLDDVVKVEGDGVTLAVQVKAPAVGPILRTDPVRLSLGRAPAAAGAQITFHVENVGGSPAAVAGEIRAPFFVTPANFLIEAGEKRQVALGIQPGATGPYQGKLKLSAGSATLEIEVGAELTMEAPGKRTSPLKSPTRHPEPARETATTEPAAWMPDLNVAKAIHVTELRPTSARLEWPADISKATKFRLERLRFDRVADGTARNIWLEIPKVAFTRDGTQWYARMSGLQPAQPQTIRVVPLDSAGQPSTHLFIADFSTPPEPPGLRPPSLLQTLIGALVICLGIFGWQRMRERRTPETQAPRG